MFEPKYRDRVIKEEYRTRLGAAVKMYCADTIGIFEEGCVLEGVLSLLLLPIALPISYGLTYVNLDRIR